MHCRFGSLRIGNCSGQPRMDANGAVGNTVLEPPNQPREAGRESALEKPLRLLAPVLDSIEHADYFNALGDAVEGQPFVERRVQHTKPDACKFLAFETRLRS